MRFLRYVGSGFTTFGELLLTLREQKRWWLIPLVVVLSFFGVLLLLGQATPLGPFIYSLF